MTYQNWHNLKLEVEDRAGNISEDFLLDVLIDTTAYEGEGDLHATQNLVAFRIFEVWSRIETQQHTLDVLNEELIPQARQTYEVALTSYQAGNTDFLTLIDNWRRWLNFELMRHRETVDFQTAFAELQREVGMQLTMDGDSTPEGEGTINE